MYLSSNSLNLKKVFNLSVVHYNIILLVPEIGNSMFSTFIFVNFFNWCIGVDMSDIRS